MNPETIIAQLEQINCWRRGEESEPQPDPKHVGEVIDAAVASLHSLIASNTTLRRERGDASGGMKLHLHVKTEYFAQIAAGTKREEYRLHNAYWVRRLFEAVDPKAGEVKIRKFEGVVIYNAYKPGAENRIEFPWRNWRLIDITHPHFGPDAVTVFAIRLEGRA